MGGNKCRSHLLPKTVPTLDVGSAHIHYTNMDTQFFIVFSVVGLGFRVPDEGGRYL